jgi:mannose-6-phosphate isomerase-like protein (cupin superfamily)
MLGNEARPVKPFDLVTLPSRAWHQFRATYAGPLDFLRIINLLRDKPRLPDEAELARLKSTPAVVRFLGKA